MRLSNMQAMMLFQTLRDSCVVSDKNNIFTFDAATRKKLAEDIISQQNKELVELDDIELVPLHGDSDET